MTEINAKRGQRSAFQSKQGGVGYRDLVSDQFMEKFWLKISHKRESMCKCLMGLHHWGALM